MLDKRLKGNARVSRVFTAGGWNGMLAELGEERIADILRETTNLTLEEGYTFDEVLDGITPSKDDLLLEAGLISIVGGVKTTSSVVINFLTSDGLSVGQAQEVVDNLTVQEQENIVDYTLVVETYNPDSLVMPEDIELQTEEQLMLEEKLDVVDSIPKETLINENVINFITDKESFTTSELQLHLKIGFNATVKIIEELQFQEILSDLKLDTVNQRAAYQVLSLPKNIDAYNNKNDNPLTFSTTCPSAELVLARALACTVRDSSSTFLPINALI